MALNAILDTRFYFSYYNPEDEETARWTRWIIQMASRNILKLGSSVITITELYKTMGKLIDFKTVEMRIRSAKRHKITFIPITEKIAERAGLISLKMKIPIADAMIAATALIYAKGIVVTDDPHFNLIKNIKVKWLAKF